MIILATTATEILTNVLGYAKEESGEAISRFQEGFSCYYQAVVCYKIMLASVKSSLSAFGLYL